MKKYLVLTPKFSYTEIIMDGSGPSYDVRDFVDVVARNKRDAVILGVYYMLHNRYPDGERYQYVHDQRSDNRSPYEGVRAYSIEDMKKMEP